MNISETISNVRQWGLNKGITGAGGSGTLLGQLSKSQEELTETRDAAVLFMHSPCCPHREELADGIGDCTVTLILAAEMAGLKFEKCLEAAYNVIKNRTGKMIDGQFVKDEGQVISDTEYTEEVQDNA
jgi:hypothetical protein